MTNVDLDLVLRRLRIEIQTLDEHAGGKLKQFEPELADLFSISNEMEESFSHTWAGFHSQPYYGDLEKPPVEAMFNVDWGGLWGIPEGWQRRSYEDVVGLVSSKYRWTSLTDISALVTSYRAQVVKLSEDVPELRALEQRRGWWSGRVDLNHRPQRPERCALTRLRYAPIVQSLPHARS